MKNIENKEYNNPLEGLRNKCKRDEDGFLILDDNVNLDDLMKKYGARKIEASTQENDSKTLVVNKRKEEL